MTLLSKRSAAPIFVAGCLAAASVACSGAATNNNQTATRPASAQGGGTSRSPAAGSGTIVSGTPAAGATLEPKLASVAPKLLPLLLQAGDLPPAERDFQSTGIVAVSNAEYAHGQSDAAAVADQVSKAGRLGGLTEQWVKAGVQLSADLHTTNSLTDSISAFDNEAGANENLATIFAGIKKEGSGSGCDTYQTTALDAGMVGDEGQAFRVDCLAVGLLGTPTPVPTPIRQVFYFAGWRRGMAIAIIQLVGINQEPSIDDFKQLLSAQDKKLQTGGY